MPRGVRLLQVLFLSITLAAAPVALSGERMELPRLDYVIEVPPGWTAEAPANSFRLAQFVVDGPQGRVNCILFYFGQGQGGSVQANIERWQSQFSSPAGAPVKPVVEHVRVAELPVTLVELAGSYARGVGMGPQGEQNADQIMRAAIAETAQGNIIFQLFGPSAAVVLQREAFNRLVRSLRPKS